MPYSSAQISGLVGGQQAMFANQAAFSHQVSGLSGFEGQQSPPAMSNPYPSAPPMPSYGLAGMDPTTPDLGTRVAGGSALALPGIAAGGSMAASLLGYKSGLGLLDPFTGVSRAFGAGASGSFGQAGRIMAGSQGLGLKAGFSGISQAFSGGGFRAGLGAVGGGLAGAAATGGLYYAAGKSISYLAENAYEGVQNMQDVRRMAHQYMQPQYGQPGAGLGGRMDSGVIKNITSFMHEMASDDVMTSMKDMRRLMDKAGQMGMLQGTTDVNQFKQRFKNVVKATKNVAQILGTTLDEAMPLVQQLNKMGMWTTQDVVGTAVSAKAAGPGGAQAMMGSMQQGAAISHAMGGDLQSGARAGKELFGQISAAARTGVFSSQDIKNITGGVGGAEGQRMVAGLVHQGMANMGNTAMGRVLMAGLGEIEGNSFTGRMDEDLLRKFQSGELTIDQVMSSGKGRINNKNLAASFFNKADRMGQSLIEQGGVSGMAMGVQKVMEHAGHGSAEDDIQNMFMKKVMGFTQRQADAVQKIIKDLPRIQAEQERSSLAALDDSFRQLNERRNRSLAGLKDAVGHAFEEGIGRPIQELSETFTSNLSDSISRMTDRFMGRTRALPRLSVEQNLMLSRAGAMESGSPKSWGDLGIQNVGQSWLKPSFGERLIGNVREDGWGSRVLAGAAAGGAAGSILPGLGTISGVLVGGAAGAMGFDPWTSMGMGSRARFADTMGMSGGDISDAGARGRALMAAGWGGSSPQEAERVARRAYLRSADATMGGLLGGETADKRKNMEKVKARIREVYNSPRHARKLKKLKEENPQGYAREVVKLLEEDGEARKAMRELSKSAGGGAGAMDSKLDVVAIGEKELNYNKGIHSIDADKLAQDIGFLPSSPEEVERARQDNIDKMLDAAGGGAFGGFWGGVAAGAATGAGAGALAGAGIGAIGGALVGGIIGGLGNMATQDISRADLEAVLSSKEFLPEHIAAYARGEEDPSNPFAAAVSRGDTSATKVAEFLDSASDDDKKKFIKGLEFEGGIKGVQYFQDRKKRMKGVAQRQGAYTSIRGLRQETVDQLERARKSFAKGDVGSGESILTELSDDLSQRELKTLRRGAGGVIGRHASLLGTIGGMGEMDEGQFRTFKQDLIKAAGGVDIFKDSQIADEVNRMMRDKKIAGDEVSKLRKMLEEVAPGTLGQGAGAGRTPMEEARLKYLEANAKFVQAVGKALGDDLQEAHQDVLAKPAELNA